MGLYRKGFHDLIIKPGLHQLAFAQMFEPQRGSLHILNMGFGIDAQCCFRVTRLQTFHRFDQDDGHAFFLL